MIDYQAALAIAKAHLDEMNAKTTLTWPDTQEYVTVGLLEHRTKEKAYGWLFYYQSNRYIETRDMSYGIIGPEPFIIEKEAGVVRQLSGRPNIDFKVEEDQSTIEAMIAYEDRLWQEKLMHDNVNQQLIEAIKEFDVSSVRKALEAGADPNTIASGITIPTRVSGRFRSDPYVVELLFVANLRVEGSIRSEVEPILLALIEHGMDPAIAVRDFPLLVLAASTGLDACVCALLDKGADVNAIDPEGGAAMHWAVRYCQMETIQMLLQRGAEINALDDEGLPPLNSLASDERPDVVSFLRSKGAKALTYISPNVQKLL